MEKWYQSYSFTTVTAFLVFCMAVRWESFVTRYMVAFFALLCPMIASRLQWFASREGRERLKLGMAGAVTCLCLLEIINMTVYHRNMCVRQGEGERTVGYYAIWFSEYQPMEASCRFIRDNGFRYLGIHQGEDDYEYPYWAMLKDQMVRMEHINVTEASAQYADKSYVPECIIWFGALPEEGVIWNGQTYCIGLEAGEDRYVLVKE